MPANQATDGQRFVAQTMAELPDLGWGLMGLYRVFEQSGIAELVEMKPGDLVRLAAPAVYGPDPDIELSGVVAGMVERTGAPAPLFGHLLGLAAVSICKSRAQSAGG
jgi:hypothetical protein